MKLLLDANVVLDVLAMREPHWKASAGVLARVESGKAKGLIAAHSVTTIYYLLSKHLNRKKARAAIVQLLNVLDVAAVDHHVVSDALSLGWEDFEDAVQAAAALHAKATHLISRNPKDFATLTIPVLTPDEFLRGELLAE
ncbi:MAG: PIN domain-containing protein [Gammaproteobacteria bacterium]|nr:PIN domain-containing protein [Gammaproteobacteria bacterium]